MKTLNKMIQAFWLEESGLTIVEYAVASALIAAAVILAFTNLGAAVQARIVALTAAITGIGAPQVSVDFFMLLVTENRKALSIESEGK